MIDRLESGFNVDDCVIQRRFNLDNDFAFRVPSDCGSGNDLSSDRKANVNCLPRL